MATVDQSGMVTAASTQGATTVTAAIEDDSNIAAATCSVQVRQVVTGVVIEPATYDLYTGRTLTLPTTVLPDNASDKSLDWISSNMAVASVLDGVVTPVTSAQPGSSTTITATAHDGSGKSASCVVTVRQSVTGLTLNETATELYPEQSLTLTPTIVPANAYNKTVDWNSSDNTMAEVVNGVVTAKNPGVVTITATAHDGSGKSASCVVTVRQPVTGLTLNRTAADLYTDKTLTLTPTILPDNASDKSLDWISSNMAVASVLNGVVTPVTSAQPGSSTTITATAHDGSGKSATCVVTVRQSVTGLTLNETTYDLYTGKTVTLTPTFAAPEPYDTAVVWTSSEDSRGDGF